MENIIFCGGCGSFISSDEISSGKVSKINNIYYCLKCSTGQRIASVKPNLSPPELPRRVGPVSSGGTKPLIKPAPTTPPKGPASTPTSPARSNVPQQVTKSVPLTPQKPVTTSNRPPLVSQSKPIDTKSTIPVPKPTDQITRRIPIQQIQGGGSITRKIEPPKPVTRFAMKPQSPNTNFMNTEEDAETRPPTRSFTQEQPSKTSKKKIYIIGGAAVVVIIIAIIIISMISSAAKEQEKEKFEKQAKSYVQEIREMDQDFPDDPQKVLDKIQERLPFLKGTSYEKKINEMEAIAKERLDIIKKINKLGSSTVTSKDEMDEKIQEYIQLRSKASDYPKLVEKINDSIKVLRQKIQEILDEATRVENQLKKDFDDLKTKTDKQKEQRLYKEILEACKEFLEKPGHLKFQEEVEKIKADAKKEIDAIEQAKIDRLKPQTLNDDTSKWVRQGASSAEFYVDDKSQMILKNPSSNTQGLMIANNNQGENWKDFTLTIEFKIVSGSLDIGVKGAEIPFPRKFNVEWQKYTIETKGDELTISGSDLPTPRKVKVTNTNATPIIIAAKPGDEIIIKELTAKIIK